MPEPLVIIATRTAASADIRERALDALRDGRRVNVFAQEAGSKELVCSILPADGRYVLILAGRDGSGQLWDTTEEAVRKGLARLPDTQGGAA